MAYYLAQGTQKMMYRSLLSMQQLMGTGAFKLQKGQKLHKSGPFDLYAKSSKVSQKKDSLKALSHQGR